MTFGGFTTGLFKGLATAGSGANLAHDFGVPLPYALAIGGVLGAFYTAAEGSLFSAEQRIRAEENPDGGTCSQYCNI